MKITRWKRLLIADNAAQLQRLQLELEAHNIRYAIGSHRPWKAVAREPWVMVPAADLARATTLSAN